MRFSETEERADNIETLEERDLNERDTLREGNNTQNNENLSHNDYIGNEITNKEEGTFRIYGGNPNGLNIGLTGSEFNEYCEEMKRFEVDTVCLYETNLDFTNYKVKQILHDSSAQIFDRKYRLTMATSSIPSKHNFKPGGTLILTTGDASGRILESGQDFMGRWSYQILSCKNGKNIVIMSAYQTCHQHIVENGRIKTMTATAQQTSILRQQGREMTPRQAFIHDIRAFITDQRGKGNGILLLGDFNEPLDISYDGMTKLLSDFELTDIMWHTLARDDFGTHIDGNERIDYVLADKWIADSVKAACYEPFSYRTKGDHRNLVLDFSSVQLFGNPTYRLLTPVSREFTSKDKTSNRKYIEYRYAYLESHNFSQKLAALSNEWNADLAEQADADHQRACEHATKRCKKKPNVAFVRKLAELRKKKNVLKRIVASARSGINFDAAIAFQVRHGHTFTIPETTAECQKECRKTQQEIRKMEKHAITHRAIEQQEELRQAQSSGNKKLSKEIKFKMVAEATKAMYNKLRKCRGVTNSGLSRLEVPRDPTETNFKSCKEWITVDSPKEIEDWLMKRNRIHFGQAKGTFPTIPPFSEWIDWGASTHQAELMLEGDFEEEVIDELINEMIQIMKRKTELDEVTGQLTTEEWMGKIKSWSEQTSTSPSGFHLTHSKALIEQHDRILGTPEGQELEGKRLQLIAWQVELLNLAITNQYSFKRWQVVVNVMILKEANNIKIHKLRVIHLYEHDYTLIMSAKWRQQIINCTRKKILNEGQYGGVPGKDAIMPTIIEELQYEIGRASKRPLIHTDYDASACYDRIIMNFGGLIARGHGQNRSIVMINATTLQQAKYVLKTKMGVSEQFYKHSTLYPIYGSGQGAGNSPGIWCCISSNAFECYESKANGAYFQSPDGKIAVRIFMIGFVDDTSGSTNDFLLQEQASLEHYSSLATHDAQRWNDVLKITGAALNDLKCSYHFVKYDFTLSGLPIASSGTFDPTVSIRFNDAKSPTPLKQLSAFTSHKTLGVYKAPAGKEKAGITAMQLRNTVHAKTVAKSPFNRRDTWSYYHAIYLPSVTYAFPSTKIPDRDLDNMQKEIKKAVLPKYGFNRNTPNAVVYGHSDFAGIEMRTLSVEKGISQLYYLIMCLRTDGIPNKLARIALSWGQLLAGTSKPILTDVTTPLPHLDPMQWIPAVRKFLCSIKCTLEVDEVYVPDVQRVNDCFIMDIATTQHFKGKEIQLINACRLFKGVTLLSDIVTPDGMNLRQDMICQNKPRDKHKGEMAYQDNPSQTSWNVWLRLVHSMTYGTSTLLHVPLGRWFVSGDQTFRQWTSYYDYPADCIYLWKQQEYEIMPRVAGGFEYQGKTTEHAPPTSVPVELVLSRNMITRKTSSKLFAPPPSSPPIDFRSYIDSLPFWEQELLREVNLLRDIFTVAGYFSSATTLSGVQIYATSDGSAPDFKGTFGWASKLSHGQSIATNSGPANGYRTTSFRAEAYGLLSFLLFVYRVCSFCNTTLPTTLLVHSDSLSLIEKLIEMQSWPFYYANATMDTDWDVLQQIITLLNRYEQPPKLRHVKGHQDTDTSYVNLSLQAQLNVDADKLAGQFEYNANQDPRLVPLISGTTALLHSDEGTITSNYRKNIRRLASYPVMQHHLCKNNHWTSEVFELCDWKAHGISIRKNYHRKLFLTKYIHDWLPLGKQISRYKAQYSEKCATCGYESEDRNHFLTCPSRIEWHTTVLQALRTFFASHPTLPALASLIQDALRQWFSDQEVLISGYPPIYRELIKNQRLLGWEQLLLGRFCLEWGELQHEYLKTAPERKKHHSGLTWVTGVTCILWNHVYSTWELRNEIRHGVDATTREAVLAEMAMKQTEELYTLRNKVLPRDLTLFYSSLDEHHQKEPTSRGLQQWLYTWEPVIRKSVAQADKLGTRGISAIETFFQRTPNIPHQEVPAQHHNMSPPTQPSITGFAEEIT